MSAFHAARVALERALDDAVAERAAARLVFDAADETCLRIEAAIASLGDERGLVPAHPQSSSDAPPAPTRASTPPRAGTEGGAPERGRGGRRGQDHARIAEVARRALSLGRSPVDAVQELLGCGPSGAKQAITKARKAGHEIPKAPTGAAARRSADPEPAPQSAPEPPAPAPQTAEDLPAPELRPNWVPRAGENVLQCEDCGHVTPLMAGRMVSHTRLTHGRSPYPEERTPTRFEPAGDES